MRLAYSIHTKSSGCVYGITVLLEHLAVPMFQPWRMVEKFWGNHFLNPYLDNSKDCCYFQWQIVQNLFSLTIKESGRRNLSRLIKKIQLRMLILERSLFLGKQPHTSMMRKTHFTFDGGGYKTNPGNSHQFHFNRTRQFGSKHWIKAINLRTNMSGQVSNQNYPRSLYQFETWWETFIRIFVGVYVYIYIRLHE